MKTPFYTVIEEQMNNGTPAVLSTVYQEEEGKPPAENRALSEYFRVLSYAALSEIEYHGAYIIQSNGEEMGKWIFDRRAERERSGNHDSNGST